MRFCPYCGKQINERARFCPLCGKSIPQRQRTGALVIEGPSANARPSSGTFPPTRSADAAPVDRAKNPDSRVHGVDFDGRRAASAAKWAAAESPLSSRIYAPPTHMLFGEMEHTGFGLRYGAWMFDFLITLIAMMTFTFIVTAVSKKSVVEANSDLVIVSALTFLLLVLNFVIFAGLSGQTIGMRILGIRIVRLDGKPFTSRDAIIRHLVGYPLSMAAGFLGFLWMLWDPRQQGWHDKLARTVVVMSR